MIYLFLFILFFSVSNSMVLFDFSKNSNLSEWTIVNDNVMGGKSQSALTIGADGNGLFKGSVSLENNGGFCSVRHDFTKTSVQEFEKIAFRLKGDGKRYQARIKARKNDNHSYIAYFETSGEWQTVEIVLADMYPSFRGRRLDIPNFNSGSIEEIALLIGNKEAEEFQLRIDKIMLK